MKKCKNPECNKEIPEGMNYCGEECLRRHQEIEKEAKKPEHNGNNLKNEADIWQGQERRKRAMETIKKLAQELFPMEYDEFACTVSYRTGLSLRKITDEYLKILLTLGIFERNGNILTLPK
jgi:hypothetical protein